MMPQRRIPGFRADNPEGCRGGSSSAPRQRPGHETGGTKVPPLRRFVRSRQLRGVAWITGLLALQVSGCATGRADLAETPLAFINGEPVTVRDLEEGFESSHRGHTVLLAGAGAVREFLDKTIDRRLLIQEAHRIGLDKQADIGQAVQDLVVRRARDQLYKDEVTGPQEVPEAAIREAHEKMGTRYRVRHILTYLKEDAEKALARVRAGEAFGAVAAEVSVSPTAAKGGDLGLVAWGQLEPRLEGEVEGMQPGELLGPLETDQGWNVLRLEERIPLKERPDLARVRNRIKMTLSQRATARRSFTFFDELRGRWKVRVHDEVLTEKHVLVWKQGEAEPDEAKAMVVAVAGEKQITLAELRGRLNPDAARKLPRPWALKQVRGILDDAIFALLLEQEALRRGYADRPEIAAEARKLEDALLLDRLLGTIVFSRVGVTDQEVRAFYDQNPGHFTEPEAVRLAMIALEAEQEAEGVLQEVRGGADFAALARARSKDPITARVGGEVGWVTKGTGNPAVEAVAFSLTPGQVGLAKTEKAHFILKLEERRPERLQGFAAAKGKAREMLLRQRRREEAQRWVARLREGSEIVVDRAAIVRTVSAYEEEARQKAAARQGKGGGADAKSE